MNENKNDKRMDARFTKETLISLLAIRLFNPKTETAAKVGMDNKKDIFAESNLLNFNILAAVIVIPDLLTPGIKDNI
tara:strand:- start:95 stop:325 length:231 start_codon:yes stop_codon:yes gene_type:complete